MTDREAVSAALADVMPRYIEIMNRKDGYGKYHAACRHYAFVVPLLTEELERLRAIEDAATAIGFPLLSWACGGGKQGVECVHCNEWGENWESVIHLDDCEGAALRDALSATQPAVDPASSEAGQGTNE